MYCYLDKTFCGSSNCKNECGRKLSDEDKIKANKLGMPIAYSCFCSIIDGVYTNPEKKS